MLIVCPSCATSYDVEPASLPPTGRQVRCLRCREVWRAEPSHADRLLAAAAALAPAGEDAAAREADPSRRRPTTTRQAGEASAGEEGEPAEVEAPSIVPVSRDESRPPIEVERAPSADLPPEPAEDIESVAARRQRRRTNRRALRWPLSPLQSAILALALVTTILIGWRTDVVRALPQTASFYALLRLPVNLRGLTFEDVATSTEQHEGAPILVVEGNVFNGARRLVDVPRLKFVVRNAARQEIYSWTVVPSRASLSSGEALAFRTRLASPPAEAHDLIVRFVNRRDVVAGMR